MSAMSRISTDKGVTGERSPGTAAGDVFHASPVTGQRSGFSVWSLTLVAVAATVPYLNGLHGDFTFDDVFVIRDNPAVQVHPALELVRYVYPAGGWYRPLTMLTYAANASVSNDPFGFHLVNLVLHVAVSLAVFRLALRLLPSRAAATAAALLFAVHPIHTEAVTGIVGRAELLAALGVLVALLAFARSIELRPDAPGADATAPSNAARRFWSAVSLTAFAAAVLAKESAFTALGLLFVLHWWMVPHAAARRRLAALLPYGVIAAGYLALRIAVVGALALPLTAAAGALDNPLAQVDGAARLRTAVIVLWQYLALLAVPLHLSADYSFNQVPVAVAWDDPRFLLGGALLIALAAMVAATARRAPIVAVAALFTVIPLALTANLLFPIGTIKGERLLYLASVGWCLAGGCVAGLALRRHALLASLTLSALVLGFAARTWLRNSDWRDEPTLFAATLRDAPDSAKAHYNGAVALQRAGRLDQAMLHYRRALEIFPEYSAAAFGIGNIYGLQGSDGGALHWYEQALRDDPQFAKAHLQLGLLHQRHGGYDSAEAAFLTGLASEPNNPLLLVNLSALRLGQGDRWRAQATLTQLDGIGTLDADEHDLVAAARHEIEVALR